MKPLFTAIALTIAAAAPLASALADGPRASSENNWRGMSSPVMAAPQYLEPAPAAPEKEKQVGAEGEIFDPPFFRKGGFTRPDGSGGFGPMASNDFGSDLDIPTVIRNLSD